MIFLLFDFRKFFFPSFSHLISFCSHQLFISLYSPHANLALWKITGRILQHATSFISQHPRCKVSPRLVCRSIMRDEKNKKKFDDEQHQLFQHRVCCLDIKICSTQANSKQHDGSSHVLVKRMSCCVNRIYAPKPIQLTRRKNVVGSPIPYQYNSS